MHNFIWDWKLGPTDCVMRGRGLKRIRVRDNFVHRGNATMIRAPHEILSRTATSQETRSTKSLSTGRSDTRERNWFYSNTAKYAWVCRAVSHAYNDTIASFGLWFGIVEFRSVGSIGSHLRAWSDIGALVRIFCLCTINPLFVSYLILCFPVLLGYTETAGKQ